MIPIFIGGTGRSGTSILKKVLMQHPNVVGINGELRILTDPGGALDLINSLSRDWTPYKADYALQKFQSVMTDAAVNTSLLGRALRKSLLQFGASPRRYAGTDLARQFGNQYFYERLDQLIQDLTYHIAKGSWVGSPPYRLQSKIYEADPFDFSGVAALINDFFDDLYDHLAQKKGMEVITHWLDDTPYNILRADMLLKVFPNMKLVHIYRDPRDVLASYLRQNWGGDYVAATARRLGNVLDRWRDIRESLPDGLYLEIPFEALALSPQKRLSEIASFIGLSNYQFSEDELALINYDRAHIGRWKKDIPKDSLDFVEKYLSSHIQSFGYSSKS